MRDLDEMIRGSLHETADGYRPVLTEPGAHFVKRYQHRRAAVTAALVVALLAIGSAAFLSARLLTRNDRAVEHPPARSVIPWVNTSPGTPSPEPSASAAPAGDPACTASKLRARSSGSSGAAGTVGNFIEFANAGTIECALEGTPVVNLVLANGNTLASQHGTGTFFPADGPTRVAVVPGVPLSSGELGAKPGEARFIFEWIDCTAEPVAAADVTLPSGGTLRVEFPNGPPDRSGLAGCNGGTTPPGSTINTGRFMGVAGQMPEAKGYPTLSATVAAPTTVRAGDRLRFEVTLTNTGTSEVAFRSCPNYFENLSGQDIKVVGRYMLNCGAAPSIGPGRSLTFEMFLEIPASTLTGRANLFWNFEPPGLGSSPKSTTITIV